MDGLGVGPALKGGAFVNQIWSFQTTGEDQAFHSFDESGVFHLMCSVSLQVVGSPLALLVPSPCGPRYWFQYSSEKAAGTTSTRATKIIPVYRQNIIDPVPCQIANHIKTDQQIINPFARFFIRTNP